MKMSRIPYSAEELAFVQALHDLPRELVHAEFVEAFHRDDVQVTHIVGLCKRLGCTTRTRWTADEESILRQLYADTPTTQIAEQLGRPLSSVYQHAAALGLVKSDAYLASPAACRLRRGDNVGARTRFPKGHVPANKGLRRPGWAPGRMASTQFVKGQNGWNWKPIGSLRLIRGYSYTKVSDERKVPWTKNWKPTHVLNWEAVHGPVPPGHALKSKDGNRLNVDVSNWQLVSRSVMPGLNGGPTGRLQYDQAPDELKPTLMAVAKLKVAARKRDKAITEAA